jgi:hypothetical protein
MRRVLATIGLILATTSTVSTVYAEDAAAPQIKLGSWGRGFFVPFYSDGVNDAKTFNAISWGAGACRIGATISGTSENVGFQIDLNGDNGNINAGDQQKIWVKPFNMLTVTVGRAYDDVLRGNGAFGDFDWLRITGTGEDLTFARMTTYDGPYAKGFGYGSIIALDPVKAVHAYVGFKNITTATATLKATTTEEAFKNITVGVGTTIGTVAMIRGQYIGAVTIKDTVTKAKEINKSLINAALKLTLNENLYADIGAFIPLKKDDAGYATRVGAYVKFTSGAIGIHALGNFTINKSYSYDYDKDGVKASKADTATGMELGLGFNYAINDKGLGLVSSFRYQNEADAGLKNGRVGALVGIEKGFSNGKIGIGVEFSTTTMAFNGEDFGIDKDGKLTSAREKATIAVPVKVEYWF